MGGGDIKLMAGLGAVIGVENLLAAAWWTALCGGVIAIVALGIGAVRKHRAPASAAAPPLRYIPYAPAIALGSWLALLPLT
jgi:prepilin peptidase CpaA